MNKLTKQLSLYTKPMLLGFLCYLGMMFLLTIIYATSQLEPLTGKWQVITNNTTESKAFPISQVLRDDEEITIKKTIALEPNRDFLSFSVYPTFQGELLINNHVIAEIRPDEEMEKNPPPYIFLSYQIPEHLIHDTIEIALKAKGPQALYLGYPPMLANAGIIKQSIFRVNLVESYVFILAIGVQLVIVFLMFVIGNNMRAMKNAYLNFGFGTLLQAVYLTMIVLAFNTTLFLNSLWYYYFVPLLMLASFIFLFQGLEYYILNRLRLTKYFWIGVPFVLLFFILAPWSITLKHRISIIYFLLMNLYMIFLSIKHTRIKLLQTALFILIFSYLSDFYVRALFHAFPLPTMQQNAMMILSFVFGSFFTYHFIKHYREEKRLRLELTESLEEVRAVNEELETSYQEIEALNNTLEARVIERTQKLNYTMRDLRMILNNTEQGFLTLDNQQRIEPTFSQECVRIFHQDLEDAFFPTLLYPHDHEEAGFVEKTISAIQRENNDLKREAYISLLPENRQIHGLFIQLNYKWIEDAIPGEMQLMIILTDITQRVELENRIETERNKLSKIIKIVMNLEEFRRMGSDYRDFVTHDMPTLLGKSRSPEMLTLIKRRLHTFKGAFASFGLRHIEKKLHQVEDLFQDWSVKSGKSGKSGEKAKSIKGLSDLLTEASLDEKEMCRWLDEEETIIKDELTDCIPCENIRLFQDDRFLRIYPEQINTVKDLIKNEVPEEYHGKIDHSLANLNKIKIQEFLNYYRYVVDNISEKLGKTIYPLVIEGDEVYIDPKRMGKWADSLIHIFRNAIDHGIETTEERIMMDKPQYGRIVVRITDNGSVIAIEISDDGGGIDSGQIVKRAIDKGLIAPEEVEELKEEALLDYIFMDGFSTKDNVNLVSGRGTGLSAVKSEWEKLGGTVQVFSEKNKGTRFVFRVQKPI